MLFGILHVFVTLKVNYSLENNFKSIQTPFLGNLKNLASVIISVIEFSQYQQRGSVSLLVRLVYLRRKS